MTNEVAVRGSTALVTSTDDYYAALAAEAQSYRGGGGGVLFLKFNGNDGYYSYGADDVDLPVDSQVAMNPRSLKRGWICWKGGQVQEEIMMSLEEGLPPAKHLLPDYGPYGKDDGWSEQKTIEFKTIDGEGLTFLFQANNKSKMNALEAVMKDFARQYKSNPGCVPVVELGENEFETQPKNEDGSKGRKVRKHAPKFKLVGWMTEEELQSLSEGAAEDYAEGDEPPAEELADEQPPEVEVPNRLPSPPVAVVARRPRLPTPAVRPRVRLRRLLLLPPRLPLPGLRLPPPLRRPAPRAVGASKR
jgi:hypothetical protein